MTVEEIRLSPGWLGLREPADAAARSRGLVHRLRLRLPASRELVIHDLACGTGAMGRWLAPLLPGPQHWVAHDRDPDLLQLAAGNVPRRAAGGAAVAVETRQSDVTALAAADLAGADLITASALLDLLTGGELARLVDVCAEAGCPVLLALSVTGQVELEPAHPLDSPVRAAFNADQRRTTAAGRLLGPDAVAVAAQRFSRRGADVLVQPSPWRLGAAQTALVQEWLTGWLAAAFAHDAALAADAAGYADRRMTQARAGRLAVTVGHTDLLVLP